MFCSYLHSTTTSPLSSSYLHSFSSFSTTTASHFFFFFFCSSAVNQLSTTTAAVLRDSFTQACINILHVYRKTCAANTSSGQLILPESLKLMPLFVLGSMKSRLMRDSVRPDDRAFLMTWLVNMPCNVCIPTVNPRLYSVHDLPEQVMISCVLCCVVSVSRTVCLVSFLGHWLTLLCTRCVCMCMCV